MIDWATIKPALTADVAAMCDLPLTSVRWVDEPSGHLAGVSPIIWLRVSSIVGVGIEEEFHTDNLPYNQRVTVSGQRQFTLSVRCESFTFDIASPNFSGNVIYKLRARLRRSTSIVKRIVDDSSYAICDFLSVKWMSYIEANRPISTHVMDMLCATVDNDIDDTVSAGQWIGEVIGSGTVDNQDNTVISTINFDVKP